MPDQDEHNNKADSDRAKDSDPAPANDNRDELVLLHENIDEHNTQQLQTISVNGTTNLLSIMPAMVAQILEKRNRETSTLAVLQEISHILTNEEPEMTAAADSLGVYMETFNDYEAMNKHLHEDMNAHLSAFCLMCPGTKRDWQSKSRRRYHFSMEHQLVHTEYTCQESPDTCHYGHANLTTLRLHCNSHDPKKSYLKNSQLTQYGQRTVDATEMARKIVQRALGRLPVPVDHDYAEPEDDNEAAPMDAVNGHNMRHQNEPRANMPQNVLAKILEKELAASSTQTEAPVFAAVASQTTIAPPHHANVIYKRKRGSTPMTKSFVSNVAGDRDEIDHPIHHQVELIPCNEGDVDMTVDDDHHEEGVDSSIMKKQKQSCWIT